MVAEATGRRYAVREADPGDGPGIQALFEASTEYFEAATGLPPGPADVQSVHYSLPPGADWQDKRILVVPRRTRAAVAPPSPGSSTSYCGSRRRTPAPSACF